MTKLLYQGHSNCAGCPETIAIRNILDVAGPNTIISNATGCTEIVSSPYPTTSWAIPYIHVAFETAASVASGIEAALKKLGKKEINVIALAGDGGTFDIGFQALSGMLERGHKVCYICLDNGAYMNTGIQRSSATPYGASTTTSPAGKVSIGNTTWKKPIVEIAAAHGIPYAASASIGLLPDLREKVKKALMKENQPSFINIDCPCPLGWRFPSDKTINIAKLGLETGIIVLYEIVKGRLKITKEPGTKPVSEYLKPQGRFKHLTEKDIAIIQNRVNEEIKRYKELEKCGVRI
ncbi:MAG: thiamine pyrophosphate-dependent enzyme [Candidatus Aenigmarchaeota archaeon]|nr:thiamine pyrophosphate-dependent enzyme [Candidatus Aenigmarchaeota archaeon]